MKQSLENKNIYFFNKEKYLNLEDSAIYADCSEVTIRSLNLKKEYVDRNVYVLIDDLDRYIELKKITNERKYKKNDR